MVRPPTPMFIDKSTKETNQNSKRADFLVNSTTTDVYEDEEMANISLSNKKTRPFLVRGPTPMYPNHQKSDHTKLLDNLLDKIVNASKKPKATMLPLNNQNDLNPPVKTFGTKSDTEIRTESSLELFLSTTESSGELSPEERRSVEKMSSNSNFQRILSQINLYLKLKNEKNGD